MTTSVGDNITHQPASGGHNHKITYSTPEEIFDCKQYSENICYNKLIYNYRKCVSSLPSLLPCLVSPM